MHFKIFLQQLKRGRKKTALYILLLAAVTAFFVMSVNLYRNSIANLAAVEDNYSTIAVMELYGDVDYYGNLVEPYSEEHAGYKSVSVKGFDFSEIVEADSVISWDLRSKYGAYIEGHPAMQGQEFPMLLENMIRFKIAGDSPIVLPIDWGSYESGYSSTLLKLEVLASASSCFQYTGTFKFYNISLDSAYREAYAEQVQQLNRSDETDSVTLYPGVEYIATTGMGSNWIASDEPGVLQYNATSEWDGPIFSPQLPIVGGVDFAVNCGTSSDWLDFTTGPEAGEPFPIQRWEDVQNDPEMKAYFDFVWDAMEIQNHAYTVTLTNDFAGVPAYHLGGASLKEGRLITAEEYESGAKVCLISERMASYQNWKIGDKLDMQFFEFDSFINRNFDMSEGLGMLQPIWHRSTEDFFYEGEYEIVGIYAENPVTGTSGIAKSTVAMPWFNIYIPEKAVENTPPLSERPVHGGLLTIRLENGSIDDFADHIESLGVTVDKDGQYHLKFSYYDQGYSGVQPGLEAMHSTAQLLLALSSVLLVVTCVLLAFFFAQNQRQSVGIFRMLGGTKTQALTAVLACALVVAAAGAALGALAGYGLAQTVGAGIMADNLARSQENAALQAFVLDSGKKTQELAIHAELSLTVVSAGATLFLPVLLILGFILLYIHQEPRALLPKGEH